jgi:hypothetical protein
VESADVAADVAADVEDGDWRNPVEIASIR